MQSPFGCSWSEEIARRCAAQGQPPLVAAIAGVLGGMLDNGLVDLGTARAIARGDIESDILDGYLLALAADVAVGAGGDK